MDEGKSEKVGGCGGWQKAGVEAWRCGVEKSRTDWRAKRRCGEPGREERGDRGGDSLVRNVRRVDESAMGNAEWRARPGCVEGRKSGEAVRD